MKALALEVYRTRRLSDCTNGGVTSTHDTILVEHPDGYIEVDEKNPPENLMCVVKRFFAGREIYHLEPVVEPEGAGWMFGGNYAATSDSRFDELIGGMYGAVAVHDRQETWDQYYSNLD